MSMEKKEKALFELSLGETGIVSDITSDIGMRRRFMDIGCMVAPISKSSAWGRSEIRVRISSAER